MMCTSKNYSINHSLTKIKTKPYPLNNSFVVCKSKNIPAYLPIDMYGKHARLFSAFAMRDC